MYRVLTKIRVSVILLIITSRLQPILPLLGYDCSIVNIVNFKINPYFQNFEIFEKNKKIT